MDYITENMQLLNQYRITKNTDILGELYELNKGLFYKLTAKYKGLYDQDDLLQECYFSLVKAIEIYQAEKGNFISLLSVVTKNHLYRCVNNSTPEIPEQLKILLSKYSALMETDISEIDICFKLGINPKKLETIKKLQYLLNVRSLDSLINDNKTLGDYISDNGNNQEQMINDIFNMELSKAIDQAMDILSDRERNYLYKRYYENKNFKEIDDTHTENNTKRVIDQALNKLRKDETLKKFYEETNLFNSNTFTHFRRTNTSGVEKAILKMFE